MNTKNWFSIWVFAITLCAFGFIICIHYDFFALQQNLLAFSLTPKFQALNVAGVVITLLSGLLAVYGFYWFVVVSIVNPIYQRTPSFIYFIFKRNGIKISYTDFHKFVYYTHQQLLLSKIVVENYDCALQKSNYGLETILVRNLKSAIENAISITYKEKYYEYKVLNTALNSLCTGVGSTIELSKVYSILLLLMISIGYVPTTKEFESAYQFLVLKHAFHTTITGSGMSDHELQEIVKELKFTLPESVFDNIRSKRNELNDSHSLYQFIKHLLGVN